MNPSASTLREKSDTKVHLISLGCPKNLVDSEMIAGSVSEKGYKMMGSPEEADTVIINTCGFIEESKKESIQTILQMAQLKEQGRIRNLVVAGCLTQRYKDSLVEDLPEVDLFVGTGEFHRMGTILDDFSLGKAKRTYFNLPTFLQDEKSIRLNSQPRHRAYLKISEGCLKRCTFCAIPLIRGNLQSRELKNVLSEARLLAQSGVKELIVVSHDFTDYGWDLRKKDARDTTSPINLLEGLAKIEELKWIRLMYLYPDRITEDVIELIASNPKFCKYFDMPLQHINDEILKRMNRKMTKKAVESMIINIRKKVPAAVIRTQFIVGFPGETREQFEEILEFITKYELDHVGCFKYSLEEGTLGAKMDGQICEEEKEQRYAAVMEIQQNISRKRNRARIGQIFEVVVEGFSEETDLLLQGRYAGQAPEIDGVILINDGEAKVGDFVKVEITDAMEYDLIGRIVGEV
jgi:ribosomal protein S12 methylthiotransferase